MAVTPGVAAAFQAQMQDNGNPIDLPATSTFSWSTDDPTDQLVPGGGEENPTVAVTVAANTTRTTLTVTASAVDPSGATITGSVTVDIVPGVEHTYSISVSQIFASPRKSKK